MNGEQKLRVGVVGLGFMGQTHVTALAAAIRAGCPAELVAVCDRHEERRQGHPGGGGNLDTVADERLFDPSVVRGYTEPAPLFADPDVDAVSICTPTDSHIELALSALAAGKHVIVEKPVALSVAAIESLDRAATSAGRVVMPAMVMRFWPGWRWLRDRIAAGTYGAVKSAHFRRLGEQPGWSTCFYHDPNRTGGALADLHIHDVDFVRWCFGKPQAVSSHGSLDHMTTVYQFDDGPEQVIAEGGWMAAGFPFHMSFEVVFENAIAQWDIGRETPLQLVEGGELKEIPIDDPAGYQGEIAHFVDVVRSNGVPDATLSDAADVTRMIDAERSSLDQRGSRVTLDR